LQPAQYYQYRIIDAWGYHDDNAGPHNLTWSWYDGTNTISKTTVNLALNLYLNLSTNTALNSSTGTPTATYTVYPKLTADGMGAAKKLYICALVREFGNYA
jgi:hypothetical protein